MNRRVQLHCDLTIDPGRAAEAEHYFETGYRPAAMTFAGYVDLQLLKLQSVLAGQAPAGLNYRFSITYESEELRMAWVRSDVRSQKYMVRSSGLHAMPFEQQMFPATRTGRRSGPKRYRLPIG
jgi:hypothetical protein